MNPAELRRKRAKALEDARAIVNKVKADGRTDFSPEERTAYDGHVADADKHLEDATRLEHLDEAERSLRDGVEPNAGNRLPHEDPANTRDGRHEYSVMKALRQQLDQREGKGRLDGIELEVHKELAKRKSPNSPVQGVLIPWSVGATPRRGLPVPAQSRALDTTAGTGTIPTILDTGLIQLLRAQMVLVSMGVRVMEGMQGLFAIPRQNAAATASWVAEGGAPSGTNQTADQVAFSPKTLAAFTDYTRRFMEQTNQAAEEFVRADLAAIIARGLETGALNGSGSSNQPTGVLQKSGVTAVPIGTNGGAPTWDMIVGLESSVANANAAFGKLGYVTDTAIRGKLKRTAKIGSTFPVYLWDGGPTPLNEYQVGITNLLPANLTKGTGTNLHALVYGNWDDLIIALWSGIDILIDPYTGSSSGTVRVVALQDADINLRHVESFAKCVDIDPT